MKEESFENLYNSAIDMLDERRLGEAIPILHKMVDKAGSWQLLDELENLNASYLLLLKYMQRGITDPGRRDQHTNFIAAAYNIAEKAASLLRLKSVPATRQLPAILRSLEDLGMKSITGAAGDADKAVHEHTAEELFHAMSEAGIWSEDSVRQADDVRNSAFVTEDDKIMMISGIAISCLYHFDALKVQFLALWYAECESIRLRLLLLIAIVFTTQRYEKRLFAYSALTARFRSLADLPYFREDLVTLQILTLETLCTHEVNRKLREEIIPTMLKNRNFNPMQFGTDKLEDLDSSNPEWKKLEGTMGKLAELEARGADVYYSTFSQLKRYPFFKEEANWFRPFDIHYSALPDNIRTIKDTGIISTLLKSSVLPDSDKYSFCFLADLMDEKQRNFLSSAMPGEDIADSDNGNQREVVARNYLRDLFRYFNLWTGKKPADPFLGDTVFITNPLLAAHLTDNDSISRISSYAIDVKEYDTAIAYLEKYDHRLAPNASICQKLGFCLQRKGRYEEAIKSYEQALTIDSSSKWTLRHLAHAYLLTGKPAEALKYYRQLEACGVQDAHVAIREGECLAREGKYAEALKEFYKAEYLGGGDQAARALAWCSVITGDTATATKYYDKIINSDGCQPYDYIPAGHAAWIAGDISKAADLYIKAYEKMEKGTFYPKFFADADILSSHGITKEDLLLMYDIILQK